MGHFSNFETAFVAPFFVQKAGDPNAIEFNKSQQHFIGDGILAFFDHFLVSVLFGHY